MSDTNARPMLTIRVSKDSGRTWSEREFSADKLTSAPLSLSLAMPPCECARCAGKAERRNG